METIKVSLGFKFILETTKFKMNKKKKNNNMKKEIKFDLLRKEKNQWIKE